MTHPLSPMPATRVQVVEAARAWLGTPYQHQASALGAGCDCLGLLRGVWRMCYGAEPELPPAYTPDWNERAFAGPGRSEPLLEAAERHLVPTATREAGDVLIFRVVHSGPAKHCGIDVGNGRFIHAYAGRAVVENDLSRWWQARLVRVLSFPGVG